MERYPGPKWSYKKDHKWERSYHPKNKMINQNDSHKSISNFLIRDKNIFEYNQLNSMVIFNKNYIAMVPNIFIHKVNGNFSKVGIEELMGVLLFKLARKEILLLAETCFFGNYELGKEMISKKMVSRKSLFNNEMLLKGLINLDKEAKDYIDKYHYHKKSNYFYFKQITKAAKYQSYINPSSKELNKVMIEKALQKMMISQLNWEADAKWFTSLYSKALTYYSKNKEAINDFWCSYKRPKLQY